MSKTPKELTKDELRRMIHILGEGCAAYKALMDIKRREEDGEEPHCYWIGDMFWVGPTLKSASI